MKLCFVINDRKILTYKKEHLSEISLMYYRLPVS